MQKQKPTALTSRGEAATNNREDKKGQFLLPLKRQKHEGKYETLEHLIADRKGDIETGRIAQSEQDIRFLHRALDFHAGRGEQRECEDVLRLLWRGEGKIWKPSELRKEAELAIKLAGGSK